MRSHDIERWTQVFRLGSERLGLHARDLALLRTACLLEHASVGGDYKLPSWSLENPAHGSQTA